MKFPLKDTATATIKRVERAIMLIETAWIDEEPMPCELEARNELRTVINSLSAIERYAQ